MRKASSVMKKTFSPSSATSGANATAPPSAATATATTRQSLSNSIDNATLDDFPLPPVPPPPHEPSPNPTAPATTTAETGEFLQTSYPVSVLADDAILPSTSTFTLNKEDRPEKLKKKTKNFMDEKQKVKSRVQSLWSYIGNVNKARHVLFPSRLNHSLTTSHSLHSRCHQHL